MTAKKRRKKSPKQKAKDKAWDAFSLYIRTKYANAYDEVQCITCKKYFPIKGGGLQAGHFIAGRHSAVLFDERVVFPQCFACNIGKHGNHVNFTMFMINNLGVDAVDNLIQELNTTQISYTEQDYKDIEKKYQQKLKEVENKH